MNRIIKTSKMFITILLIVITISLSSFSYPDEAVPPGKKLYEKNCKFCHGKDGTRGRFGAKNLKESILDDSAIFLQIQNGKEKMPSFRKKFTTDQVNDIIGYIKTLRGKK